MLPEQTATRMEQPRSWWGPARRRARPWAGDLLALAPLVVVLPVLAGHDGGRGLRPAIMLGLTALVAFPAVASEMRRLPPLAFALLASWILGLTLGVGAAHHRADMTLPLLQYSVAPIVVLSARRIWRRRWGPGALVVLLVVTFGRYQADSWLIWWGQTDTGMGLWRPLSWRNQSAALTGMFGVWFLGISLGSARVLRVGFGLLAATAFAGTWLSSSRAGLAVTVGAAVVAVVIGVRAGRLSGEAMWMPAATVAAVFATSTLLAVGLLSMQPPGTEQALDSRSQGVGQNIFARMEHSEAALGMFADRPLTGQGLGSYAALAQQWNDANGGLTSSAHNEYAEVAGETGVFGAAALLGLLFGVASLGVRLLRRPPKVGEPDDLRGPLLVGAIATAALFLVHSGVDFNWNYPVLSGLASVAVALMLPDGPRKALPRSVTRAAVFVLAALLVLGTSAGLIESRSDSLAPWDDHGRLAAGLTALESGRPEQAQEAASAVLRWNPGSPAARSLAALAQFHREENVEALHTALAGQPSWFEGRARGALALANAGHSQEARALLEDLHDDLDIHRAWRVEAHRLLAQEAEVTAAATTSCTAAQEVVTAALQADEDGSRPLPNSGQESLIARLAEVGCPAD